MLITAVLSVLLQTCNSFTILLTPISSQQLKLAWFSSLLNEMKGSFLWVANSLFTHFSHVTVLQNSLMALGSAPHVSRETLV